MTRTSLVLAAAITSVAQAPFAAPGVVKQLEPDGLLPQKHKVGSPLTTQLEAFTAKQVTSVSHNARSLGSLRPQHPSVPDGPSWQTVLVHASHRSSFGA